MERWQNKVAVVIGASSGIGADIAKALVNNGMIVCGLARRQNKIDELRMELPEDKRGNLHAFFCDVTKDKAVDEAFDELEEKHGHIHVLVYSAGILNVTDTVDNKLSDMELVMQTNFMGAVRASMRAYKSMKAKNIDGHLLYINSALCNFIPIVSGLNVYPASKHALNAFVQVLRNELGRAKLKIKTTLVNPGMVNTDLPGTLSANLYHAFPYMNVADVTQGVLYALSSNPDVNVSDLFIRPMGEFFTPESPVPNVSV